MRTEHRYACECEQCRAIRSAILLRDAVEIAKRRQHRQTSRPGEVGSPRSPAGDGETADGRASGGEG